MPRGDRTGPVGLGRMSCRNAGNGITGFGNPDYGLRMRRTDNVMPDLGMGRRSRRCFRFWDEVCPGTLPRPRFDPGNPVGRESEKQFLKRQSDILQNRLSEIRQMLDELETTDKPS